MNQNYFEAHHDNRPVHPYSPGIHDVPGTDDPYHLPGMPETGGSGSRQSEARTTRITCRVCLKPAEVVLGSPNLCRLCAADIPASRQHLTDLRQIAQTRLEAALTAFDAVLAGADATTQARWSKYETALTNEANLPAVTRQRAKEIAAGSPLAAVFAAEDTRDRECAAVSALLERIAAGLMELETL
jgi:hypothetical protein